MLVTIIIPVYNTARYLPACLDSILAQTYTDFECILIDDGSTDASGEICDAYAAKDPRLKVFHTKNAGVSSARNLALSHAQGTWVCFVDSDDQVLPDYIKDMVDAIEGDNCLVMTSIAHPDHDHVITEDITLRGAEAPRYMLDCHILVDSGPVAKLFNRALLEKHNLRFPVGIHYGEDMVFCYTYLNLVDTVVLRKKVDYLVSLREGSLMAHYYSFESEYACFTACLEQVTRFASQLHLPPDEETRLIWQNKIAEAFIRGPKCLYARDNHYTWSEKMHYLKSIPTAYYRNFGIGFTPQGFSSRIIKTLIRHRLFTLLLLIGSLYAKR